MAYTLYHLRLKTCNQIRYVGITKTSLKTRLYRHYSEKKHNPHKINWMKCNRGNIDIIPVIENIATLSIANKLEQNEIKRLMDLGCDLLNKTIGGDGTQGKESWNKGRAWDEDVIEKLRNNSPRAKKIYSYDLYGNYLAEYKSIKDAAKNTGCFRRQIKMICEHQKGYKQTKGFQFRYLKLNNIAPVEYNNDERLRKIKHTKSLNRKKILIVSNGIPIVYKNANEASLAINKPINTILAYCSINKKTKNKHYSYA